MNELNIELENNSAINHNDITFGNKKPGLFHIYNIFPNMCSNFNSDSFGNNASFSIDSNGFDQSYISCLPCSND